jgi:predicted permease
LGREFRVAIRRLAREPALAAAAIATLALGIGACTAMFSIVEAVLLKSMGVAQPQRIVVLWPRHADTAGEFTYDAYRELSRPSSSFDRVALTGSVNWPVPTDIVLPGGGRTRATQCVVSDTFFEVLGARPLLGRTFRAGEDRPGGAQAVVLSAAFWKTRLGADPSVVDKTLDINGTKWRIAGVMPPEFFYPAGADFWTPAATLLAATAEDKSPAGIAQTFASVGAFHVLARLKPGVSLSQAQADATVRWKAMPHAPAGDSDRVAITPFMDHVFGSARRALWILMGAVCLVLVLACANAAGLLVARNALRAREIAVRRALGAGPSQLIRQNLVEAAVLAAAGGALGIAITATILRALIALAPSTVVRLSDARVDAGVLAACVVMMAAVTIGVGLVPALQSRRSSIVTSIHALSMRGPGRAIRSETRRALVVVQVAITVTLLVASALTGASFRRLAALDLGFDPSNTLTLDLSRLDQSRYPTWTARHQAIVDFVNGLEGLAGVQSAAAVLDRPFAHGVIGWDTSLLLEGQGRDDAAWLRNPLANFEAITPGYFRTMAIRVRGGRDFSPADRLDAALVAIVSDNLAARLWPGENPIGKRLLDSFERPRDGRPAWRTVVGVVGSAHYRELDRPRFDLYVPLAQAQGFDPEQVVVKTASDPRSLIPAVAARLSSLDPPLTAADVTTMDEVVRQVRAPWRFNMVLFSAFGCMSIGLTVIGIAGLVVSTVNWRRREIGVRLALGAQTREVVSLITMQGARLVGAGVAAGLLASLLASRLLSSLLFGIAAADARTLLLVASGVFAFGVLACYLPARRAAGLDPASVFREDT